MYIVSVIKHHYYHVNYIGIHTKMEANEYMFDCIPPLHTLEIERSEGARGNITSTYSLQWVPVLPILCNSCG